MKGYPKPMSIVKPIRIHKRVLMQRLTNHPEELVDYFPGGQFATAIEAIEALAKDPHEFIVDGKLCE